QGYTHDRRLEQVAKLRYVVEVLMGQDMESWGMALNGRSYAFAHAGWNHPSFFELSRWRDYVLRQDPELNRVIQSTDGQDYEDASGLKHKGVERVKALQTLSLQALGARL
ncbi:MAG TPA: hypothetical protein VFV50_04010, partial [Bdellovibrionales bacterium]|nr:hypothetical protein [Bdellovibrionales bacterium]